MADPIGDPRTYAALYGLLNGQFAGSGNFAPGSTPVTMAGIPPQGMTTNIPSGRAQAFLQAMGAGSPGPVLMGAARRLAAKNSPYSFVGSGADKGAAMDQSGQPTFVLPMPQGGQVAKF